MFGKKDDSLKAEKMTPKDFQNPLELSHGHLPVTPLHGGLQKVKG
jgi:hypothetical protein